MIHEEPGQPSATPRDLRRFGLVVGSVLVALGAWFLFRHRTAAIWLIGPGAVLLFLGALAPHALRPAHFVWMTLAFVLGRVITTVVLTLFFFLVVTPMGLAARIAGRDFLALKLQREAKSYWRVRSPPGVRRARDYEQQF